MKKNNSLFNSYSFRRKGFLILIALFCVINIGFSQENTNRSFMQRDSSEAVQLALLDENYCDGDLSVSIRYYNRSIYHVDDDIIVEFQIFNRGLEPCPFYTSFDPMFTFDFDIRTTTNRSVLHSKLYTINTTQFEPFMIDEIVLKPNEVYGIRINIKDWFDLAQHGKYEIRGVFFPGLKTGSKKMYSNVLSLDLRPSYTDEIRIAEKERERSELQAEILAPYEVVEHMLTALQNDDFDTYFLFLRFEEFILQFKHAGNKYRRADFRNKPLIIENEFKPYLRGIVPASEEPLEEIPFSEHVPNIFEIIETNIRWRNKTATVNVLETFRYGTLQEEKEYTYYLRLFDERWKVTGYDITNKSRLSVK